MGLFDWFKKKEKAFVCNKSDLLELSDKEKDIVDEYRRNASMIQRETALLTNEINNMVKMPITTDTQTDHYLYDFVQEYSNHGQTVNSWDNNIVVMPTIENKQDQAFKKTIIIPEGISIEKKKSYKPIDVFDELKHEPDLLNMEDIDGKIAILKMKKEFIKTNRYSTKEVIDTILRIENRKKWEEFKEFYSQFDNTSLDSVQNLINKYDLELRTSDLFVLQFPDIAIERMRDYTETTVKLCGKKPVFYVIAENGSFQKKEKEFQKRNDPILLVQSPFGIYFQILGAWDKELVLLSEL